MNRRCVSCEHRNTIQRIGTNGDALVCDGRAASRHTTPTHHSTQQTTKNNHTPLCALCLAVAASPQTPNIGERTRISRPPAQRQ